MLTLQDLSPGRNPRQGAHRVAPPAAPCRPVHPVFLPLAHVAEIPLSSYLRPIFMSFLFLSRVRAF